MAMSSLPRVTTGPTRPANVYYFRRISFYWVGRPRSLRGRLPGALLCSGVDSAFDASRMIVIVAWYIYVVMLVVIMATEPTAVFP